MSMLAILAVLTGVGAIAGFAASGSSGGSDDDDTDTGSGSLMPGADDTPESDAAEPGVAADVSAPIASGLVSDLDGADIPDEAYDLEWEGLSAEEQMLVELVNRARLDPEGEVARQEEGFASGVTGAPQEALAVTAGLSDAARDHTEDMDDRDFFAHENPDGQNPADRAVEAGHGSRFVGENIGWIGSTQTTFDAQARIEAHHDNLWESSGHQQNLMSGRWSEIGTGVDYGDYRGYEGSTFAAEKFGDTGDTFLTGVVIDDADGDAFYDIGEGQGDVRITAYDGDEYFTTATWDSGGYTLALDPGTYRVVFEGGDLDTAREEVVTIGDENVKLDIIEGDGAGAAATLAAAGSEDMASETLFSLLEGDEPMLLTELLPDTSDTEEVDDPELDDEEEEERDPALFF